MSFLIFGSYVFITSAIDVLDTSGKATNLIVSWLSRVSNIILKSNAMWFENFTRKINIFPEPPSFTLNVLSVSSSLVTTMKLLFKLKMFTFALSFQDILFSAYWGEISKFQHLIVLLRKLTKFRLFLVRFYRFFFQISEIPLAAFSYYT